MRGGGVESKSSYDNVEIYFCYIDNIHAVRDSYKVIMSTPANKFFAGVESPSTAPRLYAFLVPGPRPQGVPTVFATRQGRHCRGTVRPKRTFTKRGKAKDLK